MKPWMVPWLLPLGLLATVVSVTEFTSDEQVVLFAAGCLLVVLLGSLVFRPRDGEDPDTQYWRIRRR
jgi:hypothetical protein